jgi:hypothetical protein
MTMLRRLEHGYEALSVVRKGEAILDKPAASRP